MYKNTGIPSKNKATIQSVFLLFLGSFVLINTGCMSSINRTLSHIEAEESYYKGDFTRSFRLTEAMAYQGEKKSEYTLGYMYYYGIGVAQNKPLGVAWMTEAAKKGYPPAVVALNVIQGKPLVIETQVHSGPFCKNESQPENPIDNQPILNLMQPVTPVYGEAISYIVPVMINAPHTTVQQSVVPSIVDELATIETPSQEMVTALSQNWAIQPSHENAISFLQINELMLDRNEIKTND